MRDDIDAKTLPFDLVDSQRDAVEGDRTLGRDRARQMRRRREREAQRATLRAAIEDACDAVDMAEHDMATEFIAEAESALEIDLGSRSPARQGGTRHGLGRDHGGDPIRPLFDYREAGARASDGCADRGIGEVEARADHQPGVPAGHNRANLAKIADDAAEHTARLRCAPVGFQDILIELHEPAALEAGRLAEAFETERDDRRDAIAADHARRAEPRQTIDQPSAQQRRGEVRAALHENAGQPALSERAQPLADIDT